MNLRFIEAFVWVARLRSLTAAAEKLYTTQAEEASVWRLIRRRRVRN